MTTRTSFAATTALLAGIVVLLSTSAHSQLGQGKNSVSLQPTTPGTSQSGHANISGTFRSAQTISSSTVASGAVIRGSNASTAGSSVGVLGEITSTTPGGFSAGVSGVNLGTGGNGIGVWGSHNGSGWGMRALTQSGRGLFATAAATTGSGVGVYAESNADNGTGIMGIANASAGSPIGVYGESSAATGKAVVGQSLGSTGINYGGYFTTNSNVGSGVYGAAINLAGNNHGGYFESSSPTGTGASGVSNSATTGTGIAGYAFGTTSVATYGETLSTTGTTNGVQGKANAPASTGVVGINTNANLCYGVKGLVSGSSAIAVLGDSSGISGTATGVRGESAAPAGYGVVGLNTATVANAFGGYFQSDSSFGRAVYAVATNTLAGSTPYGVLGSASAATNGYAVYAVGDLGASGAKTFRIDYPTDPENKYLLHYSSESPYPQNFYVGNVTTNAQGKAWVRLPEYFAEINTNFKYQLTVVDDSESDSFVQVKIGKKIQGNAFLIMTSAPNIEVSWRVDADRNDLYMQRRHPKDVMEKPENEKGTYTHPELYGMPAERGFSYVDPKKMKLPKVTSSARKGSNQVVPQ